MSSGAATPQIDARSRPLRNPDAQYRSVGDEILVLHALLKQYHVLNAVAARIWELSDGEHTVDRIATTLADEYRHDRDAVLRDALETLQGLAALRLITVRASDDASDQESGSEDTAP